MELLLARGGGKGLFEGLFLFGTASFEEEMDGDNPVKVVLDVDFEFFSCPLSGFLGTELKKTNENSYILDYFFFMFLMKIYHQINLSNLNTWVQGLPLLFLIGLCPFLHFQANFRPLI